MTELGNNKLKYTKSKVFVEDVIMMDYNKAEPCIVSFSNGNPISSELTGKLFKNRNHVVKKKRKQRILQVKTPKMSYIGKTYGDQLISDTNEDTFLGVLNKATGKIKLVEMSRFLLHPQVNCTISEDYKNLKSLNDSSYKEKTEHVTKEFGTKKSMDVVRKWKRQLVDSEQMSSAIISGATDTQEDDLNLDLQSVNTDILHTILPPRQEQAKSSCDIYKVDDIVTEDILESFNEIVASVLVDNCEDKKTFSALFNNAAIALTYDSEGNSLKKMMCVAVFMEALIQFKGRIFESSKGGRVNVNNLYVRFCSKEANKFIMKNYTHGESSPKLQDNVMRSKLDCHVIILALLTTSYEIEIRDLMKALKLHRDNLSKLLRVCGTTEMDNIAVLKLPLPPIRLNMRRDKKRKR